jgi:hypothetical protein
MITVELKVAGERIAPLIEKGNLVIQKKTYTMIIDLIDLRKN